MSFNYKRIDYIYNAVHGKILEGPYPSEVKFLLDKGCDAFVNTPHGITGCTTAHALMISLTECAIIEYYQNMQTKGLPLNKNKFERFKKVKELLEAGGIDPHLKNKYGRSAIDIFTGMYSDFKNAPDELRNAVNAAAFHSK